MLPNARTAIEQRLYRRGFASAAVRRMLSLQILFTLVAAALGAVTCRLSLWPAAFSAGVLLITCNMWWLARAAQWCLRQKYTKTLALIHFLAFIFRFAILVGILHALIVWLHIPVIPLAAGLSTVIISLVFLGVSIVSGHSFKEA